MTAVVALSAAVGWWRLQGPGLAESRPAVSAGEIRQALDGFAGLGQPVLCGGGGDARVVALTFDDGPGPLTEATLDLLEEAGVPATFFLNGIKLEERFAHLPAREARLGVVGNHTWNHVDVTGLSAEGLEAEIGETSRALRSATGAPVRLFRPPFGARDEALDAHVRSQGMVTVLWSVDSGDSVAGATGPDLLRTLRRDLHPGAIVLLHENRGTTQHILPKLLRILERRDLRPVTVPELLALDPPTVRQLRSGSCPGG